MSGNPIKATADDESPVTNPGATTPGPSGGGPGIGGGLFLRTKLRSAFNSSNDILSSISNRLSMLSHNSTSSQTSDGGPPQLPTTPPEQAQTLATREWVEGACAGTAVEVGETADVPELPGTPESRNSITVTKIKEKLKFENLQENLQELRPALEDLMATDESTEPSTLPTNTPPPSPGIGERLRAAINPALEKKFENYKALAMRTLSGETSGGSTGAGGVAMRPTEESSSDNKSSVKMANCAIKVDLVSDVTRSNTRDVSREERPSGCVSSQSVNSIRSLHATGPDPYNVLKNTVSSGSISNCNSTSFDSTDSDPHKKLWIRDGSQNSLQSWASSLSFDSQADDSANPKDFMKDIVESLFKAPEEVTEEQRNTFNEMAKGEVGRLWFARCINGKRCCRCVSQSTFTALVMHFTVVLSECAEHDDYSPAKSLMNMCFTYYHHTGVSLPNTSPHPSSKRFLYTELREQPIWGSLRFWNAAFFDALQCERTLRPVATRQELNEGSSRDQAMLDELHYQENITFGQLGTFTCNMHAFGLSKEMVSEFLRKQVTIASLREEQVKLLRESINRLYREEQEWK